MPLLRLIGLALFIVTIFLTLAALATKTTHIRFKQPDRVTQRLENQRLENQLPGEPNSGLLNGGNGQLQNDVSTNENTGQPPEPARITFRAIPVIYPLIFFAILGLVLWFVPAPREVPKKRRRRSRRKKRR